MAEQKLELDTLPPKDALDKLVCFTWNYYIANPEFITLVNSENLHKAKHLKQSKIISEINQKFISMVGKLLDRGVSDGVFRDDVDAIQLNFTIAAIGYYYLTNRHTGSIVYQQNLSTKEAYDKRLEFNLTTIRRLVHL